MLSTLLVQLIAAAVAFSSVKAPDYGACFSPKKHLCICTITKEECGKDAASKVDPDMYWRDSEGCNDACSTRYGWCYNMEDHDCKCKKNGYACRELDHGIWTDTCIPFCTDEPVSSEGCYDKEAHKCDCDSTEAECDAKGEDYNWSTGCSSCMNVDGTRKKGLHIIASPPQEL